MKPRVWLLAARDKARNAARSARDTAHNSIQLAGLGVFVLGLWLIYEPLAFLFGGAFIVAAGIKLEFSRMKKQPEA